MVAGMMMRGYFVVLSVCHIPKHLSTLEGDSGFDECMGIYIDHGFFLKTKSFVTLANRLPRERWLPQVLILPIL